MELTFYQKADQPDSQGKLMIHGRVCWLSQKVRFSTGEKVVPRDFKSEKVKGSNEYAAHINQTLSIYRDQLTTFFYKNQNDPSALVITPKDVLAELSRIRIDLLKKKTTARTPVVAVTPTLPTLFEFVPIYISELRADRSPEWGRSVKSVAKQLEAFRSSLNWADLKINTLNQFKVYLQEEEELADNTIHAYISLLRGMCEYAERSGIHTPRDIHWVETRPGEVIRPALDMMDEKKIVKAKLVRPALATFGDPNYLEKVRWYFLLACHTGLRRSDQWQYLNPVVQHIENTPCLMALQQKTGARVAIPLSEFAYDLLKNPRTDQKPPTGEAYNKTLRIIGEQAGLNQPVTVGSFYKGELRADSIPLYEAMSSHMARRTFATRMTASGMNTFTLKELMGHESMSSTQKYQSVSNQDIVKHTLEAWAKQRTT